MSLALRTILHTVVVTALVIPVGLAATMSPAAAVDPPLLGTLYLTPATGDGEVYFDIDTNGPCPEETQAVTVKLIGQDVVDNGNNLVMGNTNYSALQPNGSGGRTGAATSPLKVVFQNSGVLPQNATYTVVWVCQSTGGGTVYGEFRSTIDITTTGGFELTYSQASQAEDTVTTVTAGPADPVASGTQTTLTATIAPAAPGNVQFKRNGANFGPLVAVSGGTAQYAASLPPGTSSLTAAFTPSDSNAFQPSVSGAVSYLVIAPPTITGTPKVGKPITCGATAGGTQAFAWLKAGTPVSGATTKTVTVPAAWVGAKVSCRVTTTKGETSLQQTSAQVTIAIGDPLRAVTKPTLTGTPKVGLKLTCNHGTWSPVASSYAYAWKRDGKVISGKTLSKYLLVRADKGHKITCTVTAKKPGYRNGVVTTLPKLVK